METQAQKPQSEKASAKGRDYESFLAQKIKSAKPVGFECSNTSEALFPYQKKITQWALRRGRAALFCDTGMGKTAMQLEWAHRVSMETGKPVLVLAPLAVAEQTKRECDKLFEYEARVVEKQDEVQWCINVTNYEKLHHFSPEDFGGIVLDESSILKSFDGKTRKMLDEFAEGIHYRLACTATPAPNDLIEIINHAEFLGIMSGKEIIALYFTQDGNTTHKWRLKGHAREGFWKWVATWAVAMRKPSDLGFSDEGFALPPLNIQQVTIDAPPPVDALFDVGSKTLQERRRSRRDSLEDRILMAKRLIYGESEIVGMVSPEQAQAGQGKEESVYARVSLAKSGQVEEDAGTAKENKRTKSGALRAERREAAKSQGTVKGMAIQQSAEEKRAEVEKVQADSGRKRGDVSSAKRTVCDLRLQSDGQSQDVPDGRSLSFNGPSTRPALFKLQHGNRQVQGLAGASSASNRIPEKWIIWCDLNDEQDALEQAFGDDCVSIRGTTPGSKRIELESEWREGATPVMITKPSVFGWGMNWQHCRNVAFVGMSDSYEQQYQAIRRCWRYGQQKQVNVWQIVSEADGDVVANIRRKEREHTAMMDSLVGEMNIDGGMMSGREEMEYSESEARGESWRLMLGDACERIKEIETESVGLSVFSPPFPGMYTYSNSARDIGNAANLGELMEHFMFMMPELLRITMPGRSCCVHLTQQVAFKGVDGFTGLRDFRGRVISAMENAGWIYYGEVTIDKNPQVKAIRTKDAGLQFKSLATDSARMHMCLADYVLQFKKPGENPKPIRAGISEKYDNPRGWITQQEWIEWAAPVWYGDFRGLPGGIRETDVLNVAQARDTNDERHLCPLQLGVIERCVKLWSAPGDVVFSPFAGIGSEGFESVKLGRKFIGVELKPSYFNSAIRNLREAERLAKTEQHNLFDFAANQTEVEPEDSDTFKNLEAAGFASVPTDESVAVEKPKRAKKAKAAVAPVAVDSFFD